jgi:hypothetical protein
MSNITKGNINAIFANKETYDSIYVQIIAPTGKHCHPQFLMKCSAERMLAEGYKLYI